MPLLLMCGVHIAVCMALLVYVLCQPVHSCIEPSLHVVYPVYGDVFLFFFDKQLFVTCAAHVLAVDVSFYFLHVCTDEWLPCKKAQVVSPSYTQ